MTQTIYVSSLNTGIHRYHLQESGTLEYLDHFIELHRCQFFIVTKRHLYAVNEHDETGAILSAYVLETGELLNRQSTGGTDACYVSTDGKRVFVANYSGSISVFPLLDDGRLGKMSHHHKLYGSSIHPERQTESHPHMIILHNHFVVVSDLGSDKLRFYADMQPQRTVSTTAGSGPRHFRFHDDRLYVVNELNNTLSVFENETLTEIQMLSTLPDGFTGESYAADIHIEGRFLYVSNRGYHSIAIFNIEGGHPKRVGFEPTQGEWPRSFCIHSRFLIVANQLSDNLVVFRIDQRTGLLEAVENISGISRPICVM